MDKTYAPLFQGKVRLQKAILKEYLDFPRRGKEVPVTTIQKPRKDINGHPGWYRVDHREIWIAEDATLQTWIHEYGHHFYFQALTDTERKRWVSDYDDQKIDLPTKYARTNPSEGFAECWEFYFYQPSFPLSTWPFSLLHPRLSSSTKKRLEGYFRD